ncbi:iron-containing alcohol dehydrogenase [candidate division CSSED10-310 bacterium]|uniref:Iron-containing alcohol dehydrogenase n=1 Tax=candidate division CSSED10-310 bacterium TaxID=2855610 RepID=A0ABV6YUK6_UNCC1
MRFTIEKGIYRTVHSALKITGKIIPFPIPTLLTGPGAVKKLAVNIKVRGLKNVLVVTDKVLMELKLPDPLLESLRQIGINYSIYDDVQPNPTIENVEKGREMYKKLNCDGLIGFGGGSPMDCAKIIGARISNPYLPVKLMKGLFRVLLPIPPLFCVPTTAGSGSETTIAAVITDVSKHEKFAISDLKITPKIAVLDPELLVNLPPHITSTTGMDALTHAVESYIGINGTDFTNNNAESAVKLVFENLEESYKNGSNLEARSNMLLASFQGGLAFTRTAVGYVHAIAHNMGGLYGVPHGLANAVIMPYVLDYSRKDAEEKMAHLAVIGGLGTRAESNEVLSIKFIEKIKTMNKNMGIPVKIKELQEKDIPLIARRVLDEANLLYPVPTIISVQECEMLVRQLLP